MPLRQPAISFRQHAHALMLFTRRCDICFFVERPVFAVFDAHVFLVRDRSIIRPFWLK